MSDINSTSPLGTESASVVAGLGTNGSDAARTVLSFAANVGDGFFVAIPAGMVGYWKASYMADWRPIPTLGLNATLSCGSVQGQNFTLQVKRVPSGSDVTGIQAGRLNLLQPVTE
jgi:hypothetical protein